jgi:hypothetical protein
MSLPGQIDVCRIEAQGSVPQGDLIFWSGVMIHMSLRDLRGRIGNFNHPEKGQENRGVEEWKTQPKQASGIIYSSGSSRIRVSQPRVGDYRSLTKRKGISGPAFEGTQHNWSQTTKEIGPRLRKRLEKRPWLTLLCRVKEICWWVI